MIFSQQQLSLATNILQSCWQKNYKLTCAESCTGGLLSALFTEISGSSAVFELGLVTYANQHKIDLLKVENLQQEGAVSASTAKQMAINALKLAKADLAIAISGLAGVNKQFFIDGALSNPTTKSDGLVFIAVAYYDRNQIIVKTEKYNFIGDRSQVRLSSIDSALQLLQSIL